ncbi:hypothetical protein [Vibrio algarum]|uniref:Cellobiose phosphorylase n=1 Tax=Vibrio algarum TaxID=3020714 RepID=A0ABT4YWG6_9VIBR|nr:hypothetical protein [Vibrio sp. KJ40-1]MDB1125921.1 hypothetical protein [Vibrio sp. KJ40-1]
MQHSIYEKSTHVKGEFVNLDGERFYKIENVDQMDPFFISVVSASNHWLFISSTGCLSAGRIRPENALFPYRSVDHIHESAENTGAKTVIRLTSKDGVNNWEPFNSHHDGLYEVQRNLYKNSIGDKITFEEINITLQIKFQYSWNTSEKFGFVRKSELTNLANEVRQIELLDGIQNILPSGAPLQALQTRSALVDAYKWNEQVEETPLALFSMYAMLSDKAEPAESLRATTVFSVDSDSRDILLSSKQLNEFRKGKMVTAEPLTKGLRGAYFVRKAISLESLQTNTWTIVADIDKTHSDIESLKPLLNHASELATDIERSIEDNHSELISLMSGADAWQLTSEENTSVHHYANVLFNNMRGGVFESNYDLESADVLKTMQNSNQQVVGRNQSFFAALPDVISHSALIKQAEETGDAQLTRLCYEYLPLTFGRRHGDPSRPWNHYEIKVRDENGDRLLSYQGNWRDIFQNWEASALSYPGFIPSFIAKFVNASTVDGYNPYRITKEGVDWELLDEEDPWSNIGYWGDHQIIYLLKFLELADKYGKSDLGNLLDKELYAYANVPYELCGVEALFANPKDTVVFNSAKQQKIEHRVSKIGSDGRLMLHNGDDVYLVNLMEKMLVPLLSKLSNLVLDGGIWLNTQRPEWNDANNAIVGNGLSMVTLYYIRRYVTFLRKLLAQAPTSIALSKEVSAWMFATSKILSEAALEITQKTVTRQTRKAILTKLEKAAEEYREKVYRMNGFSGKANVEVAEIVKLMDVSLAVLDDTIANNKREDGLYNAYNIINYSGEQVEVSELYPMLEGQVAILSSGVLSPKQAVQLLDKLFSSEMYREDQQSFMLYPDRELATFTQKNCIDNELVDGNYLLTLMLEKGDVRVINKDASNQYHFNANFENNGYLQEVLEQVRSDYSQIPDDSIQGVMSIYEQVFNHRAFTGRSGTMFGYEGLGSIYWHMVSKLLLAVQENYQASLLIDSASSETQKLAEYYYLVRQGIGFNKTPENYGAFPTDPYSHTPKHSGAQQPGMTGQVKEEIITRFGELGLNIVDGIISINPKLLKVSEFLSQSESFKFENVFGDSVVKVIDKGCLAFTYCQVPFIYQMTYEGEMEISIVMKDGSETLVQGSQIPSAICEKIFRRSGEVEKIRVFVPAKRCWN